MKHFGLVICWFLVTTIVNVHYKPPKTYRYFPLKFTMQFHSLSFSFKNLGPNFSNMGIGLDTAIAFGGKHNWAQQFNFLWYQNKNVGNGLGFYAESLLSPT